MISVVSYKYNKAMKIPGIYCVHIIIYTLNSSILDEESG